MMSSIFLICDGISGRGKTTAGQIQNDLTLMFAGERIPSSIQEYAATAQELKTKEEIYSAMVVYELLIYDNGMVFIPNKELMEVLKWELVMIKKQKNTPVKQKSYRVNKMMSVWRKPYPLLKIIREQDLR